MKNKNMPNNSKQNIISFKALSEKEKELFIDKPKYHVREKTGQGTSGPVSRKAFLPPKFLVSHQVLKRKKVWLRLTSQVL